MCVVGGGPCPWFGGPLLRVVSSVTCVAQENITLPHGPAEQAEEWRAQSRLGIGIFGGVCWRGGDKRTYCLLTRVQEKNAAYTGVCLNRLLGYLKQDGLLRARDTVCFWQDGAPAYRCYEQLANFGLHAPQEHDVHTEVRWGCEYHLKGLVDGMFGVWERRFLRAACSETINTMGKLVRALRTGSQPTERIEEVRPSVAEERLLWTVMHHGIVPRSFPAPHQEYLCVLVQTPGLPPLPAGQ